MATIGFPVAFAIAPSDFGVAFQRLGVPEKFAFGIDLTFRFLPSLAADFQTTVDAQRIRGFDWSAGATGFLARVRRSTPVIVPTVVNAIAGAEDTIDAMDLRGFGTGRRTLASPPRLRPDGLARHRLLRGAARGGHARRLPGHDRRAVDAAVPHRPRPALIEPTPAADGAAASSGNVSSSSISRPGTSCRIQPTWMRSGS